MRSGVGLLLLASGCASYTLELPARAPLEALAPPPAGLAQVCVARPGSVGPMLTTLVRDNGLLVGGARVKSYFCYLAEPGRHVLSVDNSDAAPLSFQVAKGEHHFFLHDVRFGEDQLQALGVPLGREILASCSYAILVDAPEGESPPGERPLAPAAR